MGPPAEFKDEPTDRNRCGNLRGFWHILQTFRPTPDGSGWPEPILYYVLESPDSTGYCWFIHSTMPPAMFSTRS